MSGYKENQGCRGEDLLMRMAASSSCPRTPARKNSLVRPIWYCSDLTPNLSSSTLHVSSTASPLPVEGHHTGPEIRLDPDKTWGQQILARTMQAVS